MFVTKYLISKNIMYITRIIVLHLMIFNQLLYCSFMYILAFITVSLVHYTAIIYLKKALLCKSIIYFKFVLKLFAKERKIFGLLNKKIDVNCFKFRGL